MTNTIYNRGDPIKFKEELKGSHHGQKDLILRAVDKEGKELGNIQYSEFHDQPSLSMVNVPTKNKRKGIATEMLKELQRNYPNEEIKWGIHTDEGNKLFNALRSKIMYYVPNEEHKELTELLSKMKNSYSRLEKLFTAWDEVNDERREKLRPKMISMLSRMNDLDQHIWKTEKRLEDINSGKWLIKTNKESINENLINEYFSEEDIERFREPLLHYIKKSFPKEYNPQQLLMFDLSVDELINVFLNKILSINIEYSFLYPYNIDSMPSGVFDGEKNEIRIDNINKKKYEKSIQYASYVDSVIFHELIHAVNFYKKLWDKVGYDALMMKDDYYGHPEEIRAYSAQLKDFLISHLGFSRKQAENMMNRYSSDKSDTRKKWISKYHDLKETDYPLAGKKENKKSLVLEYVTNPIIQLGDYLKSDEEDKAAEIAFTMSYGEMIFHWLKTNHYEHLIPNLEDYNDGYEVIDYIHTKQPKIFKEFSTYVYKLFNSSSNRNDLETGQPSWAYMDFKGYVKNQWLIHFSDAAKEIWKDQTFKYGIDDYTSLGLTTYHGNESKKHGGFNFAYDIKDFAKYGRSNYRSHSWKYGKEAVLFRASGVETWHFGDEEPQIIFWGKTAHDIVYLQYNDDEGDWYVSDNNSRTIYRSQTLNEVVNWVTHNFDQYKGVLIP